jgi:riboflavin synthase
MFTGIIEELGTVRAVIPHEGGARIEIEAARVLDDAEIGASIAVNGCCLTVVELRPGPSGTSGRGAWAADVVAESLDRTSLGSLAAGDPVNLAFDIAVIPHTLAVTNLGSKQPGDPVNLEVDVLAKYVERLLSPA